MGSPPEQEAEAEVEVDEDEFSKLIRWRNSPRVVIDNDYCSDATVIRVDCVNKDGILLQVVQVLTDLNLFIRKAYITSDGSWFMDVFNVTDRDGNKVLDKEVISYIKKSLESDAFFFPEVRNSVRTTPSNKHTLIELTGSDRPGLLSEVCAVLANQSCLVAKAELWTHNGRVAAVLHVIDESTKGAIEDPQRLSAIKERLCNVLRGDNDPRTARMSVSMGLTHPERRLHQMMFDDRDYEKVVTREIVQDKSRPKVTLMNCSKKEYTVVILRSKDRPKLLFDTVCTLTDMQYVVHHGTVSSDEGEAYHEYFIRNADGLPVSEEDEQQHLIQCLEAAIERRTSEGVALELRRGERNFPLWEITRVFRENGLTIRRAEILREGAEVVDNFYVSETSGNPVDPDKIDSIRKQLGLPSLTVKQNPLQPANPPEVVSAVSLFFSNLFRVSFQSFRLIGSYS